jgi:CheY-like chemotaxis protein
MWQMSTQPRVQVLVVDDDHALREAITEALREAGYHALPIAEGKAALDAIRAHRPKLVLLDLMMPTMSGWEVSNAIRSDPDIAGTPVCVLSAVADRAPPESTCSLRKPIALGTLLAVVATFCSAAAPIASVHDVAGC